VEQEGWSKTVGKSRSEELRRMRGTREARQEESDG
jgi:hypothetical protein